MQHQKIPQLVWLMFQQSSATLIQVFSVTHLKRFSVFRDTQTCVDGLRQALEIRNVCRQSFTGFLLITRITSLTSELLTHTSFQYKFSPGGPSDFICVTRALSSSSCHVKGLQQNLYSCAFIGISQLSTAIRAACLEFQAEETVHN